MPTHEQITKLTKQINTLYCENLDLTNVIEKADIYIGHLESVIKEQEEWLQELLTTDVSDTRKKFILNQITPKEYLKEE